MEAPRLPSIFKARKNKRFNFISRYYNEESETHDLDKRSSRIKFKKTNRKSKNKGRSLRLIILIIFLASIAFLII